MGQADGIDGKPGASPSQQLLPAALLSPVPVDKPVVARGQGVNKMLS